MENLPFYLLFGVILATLMAGILAMQLRVQREAGVDEQAQALADAISRTCFAALARQQVTYNLPDDVGGSDYALEVENNLIIVRVTSGEREGRRYYSSVGIQLEVLSLPTPGGKLYAQGRGDRVIISSEPLAPPLEEIEAPEEAAPPEFYEWAKGNELEAVALAAAYFYALERYPARWDNGVLDVLGYKREGDEVLVHLGYRGLEPSIESWTQTAREDFEAGQLENVDAGSSPGDVQLLWAYGPTMMKIYPTDDADVYEKYPDRNYGGDMSIWVTPSDSLGFVNRGFLRFDLSGAPSTIFEAHLRMHCWKLELSAFEASCREVENDGWSESTITWNNQPEHGGELDLVPVNRIGWFGWDVSDFVQEELQGDGVASFCLKGEPEGKLGRALFDSKEWKFPDKHPHLELTYESDRYESSGVLTSSVYDAGGVVDWGAITWNSSEPEGTSIEVETRSSGDNLRWSDWERCENGVEVPSPDNRYIQYRATLRTLDPNSTPVLHDLTIDYTPIEGVNLRVVGSLSDARVGEVDNAWVVEEITPLEENIVDTASSPSAENAVRGGWLYPPGKVLTHLRQRTWRSSDNSIITIPENATWLAAAASVGGRAFCTYRFSFEQGGQEFKLFFRMLATDPSENLPGFTFTSEPLLEPLT